MAMQIILPILAVIIYAGSTSAAIGIHNWTYDGGDETSEQYWSDIPGTYCSGDSQSPINIVTSSTTSGSFATFDLSSYDIVMNAMLENNGHALKVDDLSEQPEIGYYDVTGGGLSGTYRAFQFHFHFGSNDSRGSEHTLDGKRFPAEVHIVHYDTTYPDWNEAINVAGGIAVLGFFLEVGADNNPSFDVILNDVSHVIEPEMEYEISGLRLSDFIPSSLDSFWRYNGSLTTPLCNEVVVWTLFDSTIQISSDQLATLRTLMSEAYDDGGNQLPMADNYRSIQDTNGRIVYYTSGSDGDTVTQLQTTTEASAWATTRPCMVVIAAALLATLSFTRRAF